MELWENQFPSSFNYDGKIVLKRVGGTFEVLSKYLTHALKDAILQCWKLKSSQIKNPRVFLEGPADQTKGLC